MTHKELWAEFVGNCQAEGFNPVQEIHFQENVLAALHPHEKAHFSAIANIYFKPVISMQPLPEGVSVGKSENTEVVVDSENSSL